MKFGVRTRVGESAGCRNDFKTWKERRGMVTVCFSLFATVARARIPVRVRAACCVRVGSQSVRGSPELKSFECIVLCAIVFVKPSCRDFSDKQRIQTLNHRTQRNPS
jgi:hypothetical protein